MSFERPVNPKPETKESKEGFDFESHKEFVEKKEADVCGHGLEKLTALAFMGTSCGLTALNIYTKLIYGEFGVPLEVQGLLPLVGSGGLYLWDKIKQLENSYKNESK